MGSGWPLVGRDQELEALVQRVQHGSGVVLAGPAGVGKTRLANEVLQAAVARGFAVVRVAATQASAGMPFGAFATLLPEVRPGLDRYQMLQQVAQAVVARGEGRPFMLLVDDAHLLDDASAALTHHLAATGQACVVATVRSTERAPDPVLALWKDGLVERMELEPLSESDVDDLLNAVLGGPLDRATRQLVFERSSGNVLFLRELVLGALDAGVLRQRVGVWRLEGRLPASARLVELVQARLGDLSDHHRESLELLALGQPLGVDIFEQLVGEPTLRALERRHLVTVEKNGQRLDVGLGHPLYGDVLADLLSPARARSLYRTLATSMETAGARRRDDVLRVAVWRLEGGGAVQPGTLLTGARRAWALHELPATERLARAALAAGGGFEAGLLLGQVLSASGRPEEAEQHLSGLVSDAIDDRQRVELASTRIDNLCYSMGRLDEGLAVAGAAEAAISDDACRDEITAHRASLLDASGDTNGGLAVALPLLERAEERGFVWAAVIATGALARIGSTTAALETAERGLAASAALTGSPVAWGDSAFVAMQGWALQFSGQLHAAEKLARTQYERGLAEGSTEMEFLMGAILAMIHVAEGRVATAARRAREAAILARDHGRVVHTRLALMSLVEALALAGRTSDAAEALAELESHSLPVAHILDPEAARARAWVSVAAGDLVKAKEVLAEAATMAARSGDLAFEGAAWHDLARLGEAALARSRLEELAGVMEGPLPAARAEHARALIGRDAAELLAVSATFEDMGALLLAAEAASDATAAWKRAGNTRRANAAERLSHRLAGECEGARTPALATDTSARAALSARELEIARLAAAGQSNREIAAQLYLSYRTVENKLYTAYTKLGIARREELAEALRGL
ncbi:MAG: LuxR C-terminal-related transcriptional regulator [Actinobacteria bacterium]|nr:LuxR C-terminal-related transcriptional regulator [Actinomycetota bacterium]